MPKAWGATRSAGSSSGGSAAAACGVFGLKPSRGRNPIGPNFEWEYEGQSTSHIVSRTVRDTAAMLDATAGPELGSPYVATGPTEFLAGLEADLGQLHVGMSTATEVFGVPMERPCIDAVCVTGGLLQDLGHIVEEVPLPFDESEVLRASIILGATNTAAVVSDLEARYGRAKVQRSLEEVVRLLAAVGRAVPAEQVGASRWTGRRSRAPGARHGCSDGGVLASGAPSDDGGAA